MFDDLVSELMCPILVSGLTNLSVVSPLRMKSLEVDAAQAQAVIAKAQELSKGQTATFTDKPGYFLNLILFE